MTKWHNNLKFMFRNWITQNPRSIVFAILRVPVLILLPLVLATIPRIIIDCMERQAIFSDFFIRTGMLILVFALLRWIDPFLMGKLNWAAQKARLGYTLQMFKKLLSIDIEVLESRDAKEKLDAARHFAFEGRLSESQRFYEIVTLLVANLLGIVSYIALLYAIHPLLLIFLGLLGFIEILLLVVHHKYRRRYRHSILNVVSESDSLLASASDIKSAKDVRVYQIKHWFSQLFKKMMSVVLSANGLYIRQNLSVSAVRGFTLLVREGVGYVILFYLLWHNKIGVADFVFYFSIINGFSAWLTGLSQNLETLVLICDSCGMFREFIDIPEKRRQSAAKTQNPIELKNVSFKYPHSSRQILQNINLTVKPGEKVAIVGENGAGKTTLIKLICGFYSPSDGDIFVDFNHISAVFQDSLFLPMSIKENIALAYEINDDEILKSLCNAGLSEKINSLPNGIDSKLIPHVHDEAVSFSGGELQRLLLARAIYHKSPILLLDEPTAALDPIAEEHLYKAYNDFSKEKTVIFISHRLSSTQFCDRIVLLQNGRITEQGTHNELMALNGAYRTLFEVQSSEYNNGKKEADSHEKR